MKIILLTTDTTHHLYYTWKLNGHFPLQAIFIETQTPVPPFKTFHPFETLRDAYERDVLLAGFSGTFEDVTETYRVQSVNHSNVVSRLQVLSPEVVLVFGARKLLPAVIRSARSVCLNLHGGNPEWYRGLDTHLWSIYNDDFDNLVTTLHHVDEGLDTGDILSQLPLTLKGGCRLHELRAINTDLCLGLSLQALTLLQESGSVPSRKQTRRGRYYSHMPSELKETCLKKFGEHVSKL